MTPFPGPNRMNALLRTLAVGVCFLAGVQARGAGVAEYLLKAKGIRAVAYFATYPGEVAGRPLLVGILGVSPFGTDLDAVLNPSARVGGRPVQVSFPKTPAEALKVDLLFICASEKARLPELLPLLRGRPILTMGDTPGFAEGGIMVNLVAEGGYLKVEVNLREARAAGLSLNSYLLKNARMVAE